jgi:hypothetical protein
MMWGGKDYIRIAEQDDILYILYTFPKYKPFMLAPLAKNPADIQKAIATGAQFLRDMGAEPRFYGVTAANSCAFREAGYQLKLDRDNCDYVYNMEDLRDLAGKKYHGKRNHIHQFLSRYSYEYIEIGPEAMDACMQVYDEWMEAREPEEKSAERERDAIHIGFKYMRALELIGGGILIDGKLRAFTLAEKISPTMAVVHIEKADGAIPGLYPLINREFVNQALGDMRLINREEDMGLEGLRKAKLSYHPAFLLEKYQATL